MSEGNGTLAPRRGGLGGRPGVRRVVAALLLPALVGLAGCAGKGDVSGKVTYNGQPVPAGRVTFLSQTGAHVSLSAPIKDGLYTIAGCPAGPVAISVETFPPANPAPPDASPPGAPSGITSGFQHPQGESYAAPSADKYVQIPLHFANPDKSGLKYEVTGGKQDHNVDMSGD